MLTTTTSWTRRHTTNLTYRYVHPFKFNFVYKHFWNSNYTLCNFLNSTIWRHYYHHQATYPTQLPTVLHRWSECMSADVKCLNLLMSTLVRSYNPCLAMRWVYSFSAAFLLYCLWVLAWCITCCSCWGVVVSEIFRGVLWWEWGLI